MGARCCFKLFPSCAVICLGKCSHAIITHGLPNPQTQLSPRWLIPHATAMSRILCCTRECRAGGRGRFMALLLALLLTHMTALARSWNMNTCGMTLLFIINPCPTVGNRENAFPRLRWSSLEHLHQFLWLPWGQETTVGTVLEGTAFAHFPH